MNNRLLNNNSYRHYNLPIVFPCIAFFGEKWILDNAPSSTMHFHNCIEIGCCKSGTGILSTEKKDFTFHSGDYSFLPENVAHKSHSTDASESNWEYLFFDPYLLFKNILPTPVLDSLLSNLSHCFGILTATNDQELHFLLGEIFSKLHEREYLYQDSLKGLLLTFVLLVTRADSSLQNISDIQETSDIEITNLLPKNSDFHWLYMAISYIRKNYYKKLTIAEIADYCNLSESHFRLKFNEIMHINPLDYINHLRIRIACQLIYKNEKPLNAIASDVGFITLSTFNRNFLDLIGCSPSEWRKQLSNSVNDNMIIVTQLEAEAVQGVFKL